MLYVSEDLRWIFRGDLLGIEQDPELKLVPHTEQFIGGLREKQLNALTREDVMCLRTAI